MGKSLVFNFLIEKQESPREDFYTLSTSIKCRIFCSLDFKVLQNELTSRKSFMIYTEINLVIKRIMSHTTFQIEHHDNAVSREHKKLHQILKVFNRSKDLLFIKIHSKANIIYQEL